MKKRVICRECWVNEVEIELDHQCCNGNGCSCDGLPLKVICEECKDKAMESMMANMPSWKPVVWDEIDNPFINPDYEERVADRQVEVEVVRYPDGRMRRALSVGPAPLEYLHSP